MNITGNGKKKWDKEAYVYPHLEDFHPMVSYALTVSPNALLRGDSVIECVNEVYSKIMPCFVRSSYTIRPEISTKSTILHYHGTIMWNDRKDITNFYWYNIHQLKSLCTFTIKTIDKPEDWHQYCVKQRLHMKEFMTQFNLRYRLTHNIKSPYIKVIRKTTNPLDVMVSRLTSGAVNVK